jgi:hypothetical protein
VNNEEKVPAISESEAMEFFKDSLMQELLVDVLCEYLGIRGDLAVVFVKSIDTARLKVELEKLAKCGKPDENLKLDYQKFVETREKELSLRSHTGKQEVSLGTLGNVGRKSFAKKLRADIGVVFRYPLFPDPNFFDQPVVRAWKSLLYRPKDPGEEPVA